MNIQRDKLEAAFSEFAKQSSGVVIGPPGVGKTFLLKRFCEQDTKSRLYLPIDKLGVENEADLKAVLAINSSFIDHLRQKSIQENIKKGILVIDAFDAARSDIARRFFLSLIRQVLNNLRETWTVVVSVRTFDAMKSQEYHTKLKHLIYDLAKATGAPIVSSSISELSKRMLEL